MTRSLPIRTDCAVFLSMLIATLLSACASGPKKIDVAFDVNAIKLIQLNIASIDPQALATATAKQDMTEQTGKNLADWGYPIETMTGKAYTHLLKASVNPVEHSASTPKGFSFSTGNPDPRAQDFQKTDVLPVSCELTSIEHPEQSRLLSMSFTIPGSPWLGQQNSYPVSSNNLVDHISTVCFNLLNDLKWPKDQEKLSPQLIKSGWMPEIRIETIDEPADQTKALKPDNEVSETKEGRKQITVHNQGSPVTIKFGYERR
jgi:hypothetical protein